MDLAVIWKSLYYPQPTACMMHPGTPEVLPEDPLWSAGRFLEEIVAGFLGEGLRTHPETFLETSAPTVGLGDVLISRQPFR
jgi:hypothetical protein